MSAAEGPLRAPTPTAIQRFDVSARRVAESVRAAAAAEGQSADDAQACLDQIAWAVHARIADAGAVIDDAPFRAEPVFEPFLDGVAADLLTHCDEARDAAETIVALRAIASLRAGRLEPEQALDQEELRARLRAPDAFELLVEVAHDFRSPLTSILFLAETLREGHTGPLNDAQRSQLGLVYSAAFGLAAVASDIMDLARREHRLADGEAQPYRFDEVFDSVRRLVTPIAEEKGLELRVVLPSSHTSAYGHPHALSRVLLNLATNALKYTSEGSVEMGVRPRPRAMIEFYVQDTGRGIPEDRRAELFRPFKRRLGDAQEGHFFSGSGVGLSIARRLVHAMGSELRLSSSDEHGTRFAFALPTSRPVRN